MIDGKYRYFAFICYTHADHKEAERLYKRLQHYRLPNRLMGKEGRVKRLVPVFWDHRDLYGSYRESDQQALKESKFLIVVCSKNLHNHDDEVNREIDDFLKAGNPSDHIIPFIIDQDTQPEKNCFPARLIQLCQQEGSIIGHNVFDHSGKRNYRAALLKTVARMQNLAVVELENEDQRRRHHLIVIRTIGIAAALAACILAYLYFSNTRFSNTLNLTSRYEESEEWCEELEEAQIGDIIQFQAEFVNNRGVLSGFLSKFAENNDLVLKSDSIMIRVVLPDNLTYIDGSTYLYNSNYPEGLQLIEDDIAGKGINIGSYSMNGNAYVRFKCRVNDVNLQEGRNLLITWASSTINEKVEKDSLSVEIYKE